MVYDYYILLDDHKMLKMQYNFYDGFTYLKTEYFLIIEFLIAMLIFFDLLLNQTIKT